MSRDITSGLNTEFTSSSFKIAFFFKSVWSSGTTYIWTGYDDITWDSQTWTGVGHLMGIPSVSETKEVQANGAAFSLSGVPSSLVSLILSDARQGNEVSLWVAAIDTDGSIIADPYKLFSGDRSREIRYTDRFQQDRYSGDLGLQYVATLQNKAINWGQTE
jgi:hypothetical protein